MPSIFYFISKLHKPALSLRPPIPPCARVRACAGVLATHLAVLVTKSSTECLLFSSPKRVTPLEYTRTGQKDVFTVVQTAALNVSKPGFEVWIENFVEAIGMSAGCVCLDDYFEELMLSSLGRIVNGKHVHGNFPSTYHRDFSTLLKDVQVCTYMCVCVLAYLRLCMCVCQLRLFFHLSRPLSLSPLRLRHLKNSDYTYILLNNTHTGIVLPSRCVSQKRLPTRGSLIPPGSRGSKPVPPPDQSVPSPRNVIFDPGSPVSGRELTVRKMTFRGLGTDGISSTTSSTVL